jgi:hypothetical protein
MMWASPLGRRAKGDEAGLLDDSLLCGTRRKETMPSGARKETHLWPGHGMVEGASEHARKPQDAHREMAARSALIPPIPEQNREKIQLH